MNTYAKTVINKIEANFPAECSKHAVTQLRAVFASLDELFVEYEVTLKEAMVKIIVEPRAKIHKYFYMIINNFGELILVACGFSREPDRA